MGNGTAQWAKLKPGAAAAAAGPSGDLLAACADAVWDLNDWVDAGTVGGSTTVQSNVLDAGGLVFRPKVLANGGGASGARAQGLLTDVAAGDFVHGFRVGISTPDKLVTANLGDTIEFGAAFVDGANAGTASWYGLICEYGASSAWYSEPTVYSMSTTSGAGRWDTAATYASLVSAVAPLGKTFDIWLQRTGTTLNAYVARPGGIPALAATWSVSAGAGRIGPRFQMWSESAANRYSVVCLLHAALASAVLPWEA